jgi:hypothetical protein
MFKSPCLLLVAALSLSGCSIFGTLLGTPQKPEKVSAPNQCLPLAEPLPVLTDATLAGALRNHLDAAAQYWELAARHKCLAEFDAKR